MSPAQDHWTECISVTSPRTEIPVHHCYYIAVSVSELEITETGEQGNSHGGFQYLIMALPPLTANWFWKNKSATSWGEDWLLRELTTISITGDSRLCVESDHGRGGY